MSDTPRELAKNFYLNSEILFPGVTYFTYNYEDPDERHAQKMAIEELKKDFAVAISIGTHNGKPIIAEISTGWPLDTNTICNSLKKLGLKTEYSGKNIVIHVVKNKSLLEILEEIKLALLATKRLTALMVIKNR